MSSTPPLPQFVLDRLAEKCGLIGQTILVVGAGGTIGDPTVEELAARGARVIPTRQTSGGLEDSIEKIRSAGDNNSCPGGVQMQMSDPKTIDNAMSQLRKLLGSNTLTGVLVNAGGHNPDLIIGPGKHFHETTREDADKFMQDNLLGQREVFRQVSQLVCEQENFTGIATCSVAPANLSRVLDYRMAKAAWEEMIRFLALDHGQKYGHNFIGVAPGFVNDGKPGNQNSFAVKDPTRFQAICDHIPLKKRTPFNPEFEGWATGSELADVFASLYSKSFRYVNGDIIYVDGGFSINALGNEAI